MKNNKEPSSIHFGTLLAGILSLVLGLFGLTVSGAKYYPKLTLGVWIAAGLFFGLYVMIRMIRLAKYAKETNRSVNHYIDE